MDLSGEFPMRPVKPIDLEAGLAAAWVGDDEPVPSVEDDMVILVDPLTRKMLLPSMPSAQAARIMAIFDEIASAEGERGGRARRAAFDLRGLVGDASMVAHDMRALMYLFQHALTDDGPDTPLNSASHLVVDCIETMAKRLDALEEAARHVYAPLIDGPHR